MNIELLRYLEGLPPEILDENSQLSPEFFDGVFESVRTALKAGYVPRDPYNEEYNNYSLHRMATEAVLSAVLEKYPQYHQQVGDIVAEMSERNNKDPRGVHMREQLRDIGREAKSIGLKEDIKAQTFEDPELAAIVKGVLDDKWYNQLAAFEKLPDYLKDHPEAVGTVKDLYEIAETSADHRIRETARDKIWPVIHEIESGINPTSAPSNPFVGNSL
jgi:hypothetical protein